MPDPRASCAQGLFVQAHVIEASSATTIWGADSLPISI